MDLRGEKLIIFVLMLVIESIDYDYEHRFAEQEQEWDVSDGSMKSLKIVAPVPINSRMTEN